MRIDLHSGPQAASELNRSRAEHAARNGAADAAAQEDQAQLSGAHAQVQALAAQASQLPDIRQERVQALRHAVQSGQYHAASEKVANAVFEHLVVRVAA